MKIYLASSFTLKERVKMVCEALESVGHEIVEKWWTKDYKELDMPDEQWYEHSQVEYVSARNFKGVKECDVFIMVSSEDEPTRMKGADVELGYALGHGKPTLLIGELLRSAMYFPLIQCSDVDELKHWLNHIAFYKEELPSSSNFDEWVERRYEKGQADMG